MRTPASAGPGELGARARDLELRVAVDELVARHERRQVRLVGDVEEHRQHADDEADDVELPDRQRVEGVRERDRREQRRAPEVADDEDRPPRQAVDPDAGREAEEDERRELDDAEQRRPRTR